ncbi:unnamed protein product [Urochloa humidicola]
MGAATVGHGDGFELSNRLLEPDITIQFLRCASVAAPTDPGGIGLPCYPHTDCCIRWPLNRAAPSPGAVGRREKNRTGRRGEDEISKIGSVPLKDREKRKIPLKDRCNVKYH